MHWGTTLFLLCLSITLSRATLFSVERLRRYARILNLDSLAINDTGNELWHGLFKDCDKRVTFSCIQKNAYTYLDNVFIERDNITVFDGLVLTRNNVTYDACPKLENRHDIRENLVDDIDVTDNCNGKAKETEEVEGRKFRDEPDSPLEEITDALREKTVKFLSTRNYEIQLPQFFFEGTTVKVSPREIDENGALLRVDFGAPIVQQQGRIFKKIRRFIQTRLLTALLALLLIIKLIKVKFLFVIPFLFGVGAAKKLFLKLLLFFIPAFAHIFKLCSSYYSHATKLHHHHHQIAHHHHHVPVPVAIPYFKHHHHHDHHDDYDGYEYPHPHIQYRKDMEELKEWGIEPYEGPYDDPGQHLNHVVPAPASASASGSGFSGSYGLSQYAANVKPLASSYLDNTVSANAHNLAYSGYINDKYNRRPAIAGAKPSASNPYAVFAPNLRPAHHHHHQRIVAPITATKSVSISRQDDADDEYYGPIVSRLEDIFGQLRFHEETCREMLICSMYKNPANYSPHSNIVSHELSRDPQELKRGGTESASSQKFYRYLSAARHGQDGGDCLRTYPCRSNAE